jgi:hypothetical protein
VTRVQDSRENKCRENHEHDDDNRGRAYLHFLILSRGTRETRTPDTRNAIAVLCQLSYSPVRELARTLTAAHSRVYLTPFAVPLPQRSGIEPRPLTYQVSVLRYTIAGIDLAHEEQGGIEAGGRCNLPFPLGGVLCIRRPRLSLTSPAREGEEQ